MGFVIPLPDAGESIFPFFICFGELPAVVPMALEPDAPGVEPVMPLTFGVPIPFPPGPAPLPSAVPPAPPPAPCA